MVSESICPSRAFGVSIMFLGRKALTQHGPRAACWGQGRRSPLGAGTPCEPVPRLEAGLGGAGRWHCVVVKADGILPAALRTVFL